MSKPQFFIPNVDHWKWNLVSPTFVKLQLSRANMSYDETTNALDNLDADTMKIQQEIRGQWAGANVQVMRAFEERLKKIGGERKRIMYLRLKLREVIDIMREHLKEPIK